MDGPGRSSRRVRGQVSGRGTRARLALADRYRVVRELERSPTSIVFEARGRRPRPPRRVKGPRARSRRRALREEAARRRSARRPERVPRVRLRRDAVRAVRRDGARPGRHARRTARIARRVRRRDDRGRTVGASSPRRRVASGVRTSRGRRRRRPRRPRARRLRPRRLHRSGHADGDETPTAPRNGAATTIGEKEAGTPTASEPASDEETGGTATTDRPATTTEPPKPNPNRPLRPPARRPSLRRRRPPRPRRRPRSPRRNKDSARTPTDHHGNRRRRRRRPPPPPESPPPEPPPPAPPPRHRPSRTPAEPAQRNDEVFDASALPFTSTERYVTT